MKSNEEIYQSLVMASSLESAVAALSDQELRNVRGALNRNEFESWPAELVHGVCLVEGCERFMNQGEDLSDRCHGAEVKL